MSAQPHYAPSSFSRERAIRRSDAFDYRLADAASDSHGPTGERPWNELIGPVLFTRQVADRMDWSTDQVEAAQKDHALLACRTRDGVWVFPTFQFKDEALGELVPGFADIMRIFQKAEVDAWAVASWFVTPLRTLAGRSPIESLHVSDGATKDAVRNAALDQSRAWQQ